MSATPLPTTKKVRDLHEILLGRAVEVSPDYEVLKPDEKFGCYVAFFNDAMGAICAACIMGLNLYAYAGVALQLIPAAGAQDCINNECLDDSYTENVYEALNVFSSLFNGEGAPHVSIGLMYTSDEEPPTNECKMATSYAERRDSILNIEGYGRGHFGVTCSN